MRLSYSEYRPIPMSTCQVLQSYALLRTAHFDACFDAHVNLNGFGVSTQAQPNRNGLVSMVTCGKQPN